ncbi:acyl-CoA dehydrogenase family protein [Streptomyces monticola]|uniref:Acyl-CoA dehydrogenase family protein n=1 Tax=Streptomyces monticola TaxID=2666263 RepID=A0ABW2JG32_9ACTN
MSAPTAPDAPNAPAGQGRWPRVAQEVADDLAVDAAARDRAGKPPFDEAARLREAGLLAFLTPPGPQGRGADWLTACAVVRQIAAADSSVGELLAHHYVSGWAPRFFGGPRTAGTLEARAAAEHWLWGGATEPAEAHGRSPGRLTLTPARGGYVLNGRRALAAGASVADRFVLAAPRADTGETLIAVVDPAHPGVSAEPAHDRLGQRLTGAGTLGMENVPVAAAHILGLVPRDEHAISPFTALAPLALRLMLTQVGLGNAEGALAEARDASLASPHGGPVAAPGTGGHLPVYADGYADGYGHGHRDDGYGYGGSDRYDVGPAADDPYLLLAYGELATSAHTAGAVVARASEALAQGLLRGAALDIDERAEIAVLVSAAEAVTAQAALRITTRVLELTARADDTATARTEGTGQPPGFDRFWRNARVLTALDSPSRRLRAIGDHYLNGTPPPLTLRA